MRLLAIALGLLAGDSLRAWGEGYPFTLRTGQSQGYAGNFGDAGDGNGDDGDLRKGRPRHYQWVDDGLIDTPEENVVLDANTGLMWIRDTTLLDGSQAPAAGDGTRFNSGMIWQEAVSRSLGLEYAGYSDWRLPNVNELHTLADYGRIQPALDTTVFPGGSTGYTWTSTTDPVDASRAWYVNFVNGHLYPYTKNVGFIEARPVRSATDGEPPVPVRRTGQTVSFAPGDDGDLQMGVVGAYLIEDGTEIVTQQANIAVDQTTGLMWIRDVSLLSVTTGEEPAGNQVLADRMDWQTAIDRCGALVYGGYDDWRLPNLFELISLFHLADPDGAMNPDVFRFIPSGSADPELDAWWTSTTASTWSTAAWFVTSDGRSLNHGPEFPIQKLKQRYVLPVRDAFATGPMLVVR